MKLRAARMNAHRTGGDVTNGACFPYNGYPLIALFRPRCYPPKKGSQRARSGGGVARLTPTSASTDKITAG